MKGTSRAEAVATPLDQETSVEYDPPTAVTFLLVGLALGSILATLFSPSGEKLADPTKSTRQTISSPSEAAD